MKTMIRCAVAMGLIWLCGVKCFAEDGGRAIETFERKQLTDVYYAEGIAAGDINHDGVADVVYGPYWFAGPDFKEKHEIYPATPQPTEKYADHFFSWVYDFNGDGWPDVLTVGFPGTPGYVYENPGPGGWDTPWKRHEVMDHVSNESPQWAKLVGDQMQMVCSREGYFGYWSWDKGRPFEKWEFHAISEKVAPIPFGHGLGVGDIDGDGRADVITKDGWYQQPASGGGLWAFHQARFAPAGGADMFAYDVDGDGLTDVITSLAAHEFGLAWFQQVRDEQGNITFKQHPIMGGKAMANRYGVVFSELHSVTLADMDGDGLKDIVTGKTYYSHHKLAPGWDAGAVVYWFQLKRTKDGVDWIPHLADGEAGIGRQIVAFDLNGDGLPDLLSGGMKGAHVMVHHREMVTPEKYEQWMPKVVNPEAGKVSDVGPMRVKGAIEAEGMKVLGVSGGKVGRQNMAVFSAGRWSGDEQLFWTGGKVGDRLELEIEVPAEGDYRMAIAFTRARDYAIVQVKVDDREAGKAVDLFNAEVVVGEEMFEVGKMRAGKHKVGIEVTGANEKAVKSYMVGVDYVRLIAR